MDEINVHRYTFALLNLAQLLPEQKTCTASKAGHSTVLIKWLDYSPLTKANRVRFPVGSPPGSSHIGIEPDDAAGRWVFSAISPNFTLIGSQDLEVKSRPNLFSQSNNECKGEGNMRCLRKPAGKRHRIPFKSFQLTTNQRVSCRQNLTTERYGPSVPRSSGIESWTAFERDTGATNEPSRYAEDEAPLKQTTEAFIAAALLGLKTRTRATGGQSGGVLKHLVTELHYYVHEGGWLISTVASATGGHEVAPRGRCSDTAPRAMTRRQGHVDSGWASRSSSSSSWSSMRQSSPESGRSSGLPRYCTSRSPAHGDENDSTTCIKCAIASKRKALNWRTVLSHCVYLMGLSVVTIFISSVESLRICGKGGGDPRENPADQRHRSAQIPSAEIRERLRWVIEPSLPRREASCLTTTPPRPRTSTQIRMCDRTDYVSMGIVPDYAVSRRVFSEISRFPRLFIPALLRCSIFTSITLIGSEGLDVKSRPNLSTYVSTPNIFCTVLVCALARTSVNRQDFKVLYIPEPASFLHWLLQRREATPFLTEMYAIGAHNSEMLIYWRRVTQLVSDKVWSNDKPRWLSGNSLDSHSGGLGFDSRYGYPGLGFPWFSAITPGECWGGFLTNAMADSFPFLPQSLFPVQLAPHVADYIAEPTRHRRFFAPRVAIMVKVGGDRKLGNSTTQDIESTKDGTQNGEGDKGEQMHVAIRHIAVIDTNKGLPGQALTPRQPARQVMSTAGGMIEAILFPAPPEALPGSLLLGGPPYARRRRRREPPRCRRRDAGSYTYTQHDENTAFQFRALRLAAMVHFMLALVRPLLLSRLSDSETSFEWRGEIWAALKFETLRAEAGETKWIWRSDGMQVREKLQHEKPRQLLATFTTFPTGVNAGLSRRTLSP
ncbi:hypothetical protein PR048_009826 [Dryococelus australis]|uniref:Uncharacterized protein n=1 Tax=Dryococelus australis TaxID=614101 RepID=A0ABQ9I2U9_9NEOP|nr:hypothetical protein PR048_009826 [Dryococelus australis]